MGGWSGSAPDENKTSPLYGGLDFWCVRLDSDGNKLWETSDGGTNWDTLRSIQQTADGGFILGGETYSGADGNKTSTNLSPPGYVGRAGGSIDYWLVRIDTNGVKLWEQEFGSEDTDRCWSLDHAQLRSWRDTNRMIAERHAVLPDAALISLDHDLNKEFDDSPDRGDGVEVAAFLARLPRICPVILHTSNAERVWSMDNEFRFGGWETERVMPLEPDWVARSWLPAARRLLEKVAASESDYYQPGRDAHQGERLARALTSLYGLALGDGIGEMMFSRAERAFDMIMKNVLPAGPWWHTDDTEMAISVVEVLRLLGTIHQDALARQFMARFETEPDRGYGSGARRPLSRMLEGAEWRVTSREAFGGQGSLGNGSAMRVAPVGAWFADDLDRVVKEARASAMVTHMHSEGVAGAVVVGVAAAMAWRLREKSSEEAVVEFLNEVHKRTPDGETCRGIAHAFQIRHIESSNAAARMLGNGSGVTCPDTVPFTVWAAAKFLGKYREAIAATAAVGGDVDTNCAIVGGIVAVSTGWQGLPRDWLEHMERLPYAPPQGSEGRT